jgi:putative membrane protein
LELGVYMQRLIVWLFNIYLFIYVWAVPMLMFSLVPSWGTWMGGFLLILQGSLLALWLAVNAGIRGVIAAVIIAVLSFWVEYVGVTTGLLFGQYSYTDVLGLKVFGTVPLPIPFAWLLVVPASIGAARLLGAKGWWVALVAPALALGLDLLLEPVAAYVVNYWQWIESGPYYGVPNANFVAWGATALVLTVTTLALVRRDIERAAFQPLLPAALYFLNLFQFTLVNLTHTFWIAAAIGTLLVVGAAWVLRREITARRLHWRGGVPKLIGGYSSLPDAE